MLLGVANIWQVLKDFNADCFDVDILGSKISFDVDILGFKNPKIYSYVLWRQIWRFLPKCWRLFRLNTWSHWSIQSGHVAGSVLVIFPLNLFNLICFQIFVLICQSHF